MTPTNMSYNKYVACVASGAWRFWLGALSNKGGREQRNREEIGAGATVRANFAASPLARRARQNRLADAGYLQWSGACFRVRGASPLPGSFLLACLFCAEKWIFPENFCTLHNIDLLQLPQTPPKFNLANKKFRLVQIATTWVQADTVLKTNKPFHKLRIDHQHPSLY